MTPAIVAARQAGVSHRIHEYSHQPGTASYGLEAADKLGLAPERVFKTLVAQLDGHELVVGLVPVACQLNLKSLAKAAQGKKAIMADPKAVERSSGYVLGGVSPLGQKRRLRTFIDETAVNLETLFVSAGRRGLEIELAPQDLAQLLSARFAPLSTN